MRVLNHWIRHDLIRRFAIGAMLVLAAVMAFSLPGGQHTSAQSDNCNPGFSTFEWGETDFCNASVDFSEIIAGGPPKDGILALNDPVMESVDVAARWLVDQSPVIAVEIDGEARAYPQAILIRHEIANDVINDVPVAVTFCPLCNSSIVFDRRVDGEVLDFGVSGMLRNSDMIMYDRQTDSWWQQFIGVGIVGHYNETVLDIIPSLVIGFGDFAERYPDGLVMSSDQGFGRGYGTNPYVGYSRSDPSRFLFRGEVDSRLPGTERVLAYGDGDTYVAYPFATLSNASVINDTIGDMDVVAMWQPGVADALDESIIDLSRDLGTAALYDRVLDGQMLTFSLNGNGTIVDNQTGSTWNVFGQATAGELEGAQLRQLIAAPHFWFAWAAFHPQTTVYGQS
ncbi:MAG: DUF3179 domain-containing protein [Anaerolineae bacterium]|nr:DUF3179 domain-containing protein [Anaerolineae bacterium]